MTQLHPSALYQKHKDANFDKRAEQFAYWTLPQLFPEVGLSAHTSTTQHLARDWQSLGAQLVNHLASKFVSTLFPAGMPFFKLALSSEVQGVFQQVSNTSSEEFGKVRTRAEVAACERLMVQGNYNKLAYALKLLLVVGNCLIFRPSTGRLQVYSPRNYVILRDGNGDPLCTVLKEARAWELLPAKVRAQAGIAPRQHGERVDLYTMCMWGGEDMDGIRMCTVTQQIDNWLSTETHYRAEVCPFIPAALDLIPGESLGRGYVEAHAGDFGKYSELSKAVALYEIEASRVLHLVKPGSGGDIDAMNNAACGQYVSGDPGSITAHEAGDGLKLQALQASLQLVEQRLARAFAWGGNMRDGERVTALEVARNAAELDVTFGGAHSSLSATLHPPLAHLLLQEESPTFVQTILQGGGSIDMLTGMAALARAGQLTALLQAASEANALYNAAAPLTQRLSPERIFEVACAARGADPDTVYRTEEELAALEASTAPVGNDVESIHNALQGTLSNV